MPALYALAQHDALASESGAMMPDEHVCSFLDDHYLVTSQARAAEAYEHVSGLVEEHLGARSHTG